MRTLPQICATIIFMKWDGAFTLSHNTQYWLFFELICSALNMQNWIELLSRTIEKRPLK